MAVCYYGRIKLTLTRLDHSEEANSAAEYVTIRDKLITWSRKTENLFGCQTTSFFDCYGGDLDPFLASFLQSRRSSFSMDYPYRRLARVSLIMLPARILS